MKNRFFALIMVLLLTVSTMVGCSGNNDVETVTGSGNDRDTKVDKPEETDPYESLTIERTETAAMEYEEVSSDDGYTGDRYEVLEAGSQYYNLPVSGTIVK